MASNGGRHRGRPRRLAFRHQWMSRRRIRRGFSLIWRIVADPNNSIREAAKVAERAMSANNFLLADSRDPIMIACGRQCAWHLGAAHSDAVGRWATGWKVEMSKNVGGAKGSRQAFLSRVVFCRRSDFWRQKS